jgi:methionyl-tRNA formyltransferase
MEDETVRPARTSLIIVDSDDRKLKRLSCATVKWRPTPQASENSSRAPKITRLHSVLDWEEMSSAEIERRYRALGHQVSLMSPCCFL